MGNEIYTRKACKAWYNMGPVHLYVFHIHKIHTAVCTHCVSTCTYAHKQLTKNVGNRFNTCFEKSQKENDTTPEGVTVTCV